LVAAPERDERRAAVEAALAHLPEDQRTVLVLKVWGGLTFPQIADALSIPANTAASRYRYALDKLRTLLAEARVP
jgi:RNA polymerase sigma-70 factor (ECF subfamily)